MMQIGLIGKANVGKSTFFNAATDLSVGTANYPFTTIKPNIGICYARQRCVCTEFGIKDNPIHSICIDGVRFIPVQILDVARTRTGAHMGKGLGNQFLDDARQVDALVHVVDVSGSTDQEGRFSSPGSFDPSRDVNFVEEEFDFWLMSIIKRDLRTTTKDAGATNQSNEQILRKRLSGLGISEPAIDSALNLTGLKIKKINAWTEQDILFFTKMVREKSKPMVIATNKADISTAELNIQAISKNHTWVIPCTSEGESLLKKASKNGIVHYLPGDNSFEIRNTSNVTEKQSHVLGVVSKFIKKYGSTGIQQVINTICFEILEKIVVYPVENEIGLTDKKGNILPEAYLVDKGTTAKHLAADGS